MHIFGENLGEGIVPCPAPLGHDTKQNSAKYTLNSRNQIVTMHACGRGLRSWHFTIILISLRIEVAKISDFLGHAKILPLGKAFFNLNIPHSTLGKKDITLLFYIYPAMACSEVAALFSTKSWGTLYFKFFLANVITV